MSARVGIVGGGVAGLTLARDLSRDHAVILFESTGRTGGRVRTEYEDGAKVSYEAGAWRVDETHTRVREEFARYGVALEAAPRAVIEPPASSASSSASLSRPSDDSIARGISQWDAWTARQGPSFADEEDLRTGYAGVSDSANGSDPYQADGPFFVAPLGFSEWIQRLESDVRDRGVNVRTSTRVEDMRKNERGRYELVCKRRDGNRFHRETHIVDQVVLCTPPSAWQDWPLLRRYARSLSSAVDAEILHHIYVRSSSPPPMFSRVQDGQNVVAPQYATNAWWQVSYSSGRVARYWHNLALQDDKSFLRRIRTLVGNVLGNDERVERVKRHYWAFAIHKWKPVPHFDLKRAVHASIRVNPHWLPNVFCAGEAFSSHQGWMEGALQTAEMVSRAMRAPPPDLSQCVDTCVLVEGRPVDVGIFANVHPGSSNALTSRYGQDVDDFLLQYHHSPHAWAIVHSLKIL